MLHKKEVIASRRKRRKIPQWKIRKHFKRLGLGKKAKVEHKVEDHELSHPEVVSQMPVHDQVEEIDDKVAEAKRGRVQSLSRRRVLVEVTDACNLQCRSCVNWTPRGHSFMSMETYKAILEKVLKANFRMISFYWRGESTLHPKLPEMMKIAKEKGLKTYCPSSFASPLLSNKEYMIKFLRNITRFRFNFDGYDEKSIQRYRVGTRWDVITKNLEVLNQVSAPCPKYMAVLMFRYNEEHQDYFEGLVEKYNHNFGLVYIRPTILGKNVLTNREAKVWLAKDPKYQRYCRVDHKLLPKKWLFRGKIIKRSKNHAWIHQSRPKCSSNVICISVHGDVGCCSQDTYLRHPLGNILKDSFQTIRERHAKIAGKLYHRQMDLCKTWCICRHKKVDAKRALKQIQAV